MFPRADVRRAAAHRAFVRNGMKLRSRSWKRNLCAILSAVALVGLILFAVLRTTEESTSRSLFRRNSVCPISEQVVDEKQSVKMSLTSDHVLRSATVTDAEGRVMPCARSGLWAKKFIDTQSGAVAMAAKLLKLAPLDGASVGTSSKPRLLEWGSDCGYNLRLLSNGYNVEGVGVDPSASSIEWAEKFTPASIPVTQCYIPNADLRFLPSQDFDYALSFGFLSGMPNEVAFCYGLRQLVRTVKPGGRILVGWISAAEFVSSAVPTCLADLPVSGRVVYDMETFRSVLDFPLKPSDTNVDTYSILMTVKSAGRAGSKVFVIAPEDENVAYNDYTQIPFSCEHMSTHRVKCTNTRSATGAVQYKVVEYTGGDSVVMDAGKVDVPEPVEARAGSENGKWPACPPVRMEALDNLQIPLKHLPRRVPTSVREKYERRANNCAGNGVWHKVSIEDHRQILTTIADLLTVQRGDRLFDWGSGCGHQLQFMYDEFGATGLGIDLSIKTVAYSKENTTSENEYCVADGTKLEWLPSKYFDHSYSFGSVYHVYNDTLFCHVIQEMVRIVKPGGYMYNGWTEDSEYARDKVVPCLSQGFESHCLGISLLDEGEAFKKVKYFPLKARQARPNTYSILVKRLC